MELGQALESAFGGGSLGAVLGDRPEPETEEPAAHREPDEAPEAPPAPEPPAEAEWYAAIGEAHVGPLLVAGMKAKWESGEIGPDTLVWSAGLADWTALSAVPELARLLAPVQRPPARQAARGSEVPAAAAEPGRGAEAAQAA